MSAASAATRASDRRRSSCETRQAIAVMMTARTSEINVTRGRNITTRAPSAQLELDGDFNNHVNWHTMALRGREPPLPDGLYRLVVQPAAEALQDADVADRAVASHDDFQDDLALQSLAPGLFGVIGTDLFEEARRFDTAAGPIGSTAGPTTRSFADAGTLTRANARSRARSCTAACAGAVAFVFRRGLIQHSDARTIVGRRGDDRGDDDWKLLRLQRRLGFGFRRLLSRSDWLRLATLGHGAADRAAAFPHCLRRRCFLP